MNSKNSDSSSSNSSAGRSYPLSVFLVLIVLIAVVPFIGLSLGVMSRLVAAKQELNERFLAKNADELAMAFDQEITATVRTLEAMSMSASLRRTDLPTFLEVSRRVLKGQPSWATILLHDVHSTWLLNARLKFGTKLGPPLEPASLAKVAQTGAPAVGRIFNMATMKSPNATAPDYGFAVRVPVRDTNGKIIYILSAILDSDGIQDLVKRFATAPDELTRTIVDEEGIIVARSRDPEKFVGGPAAPSLVEILKQRKESGLVRTKTLEGVPAYSAYKRAPLSGWYAALAVPAAVVDAQAQNTRRAMFQLGLALLLFSTLATWYFSGWIRNAISAGAQSAANLVRGEDPNMRRSGIREMEELRRALQDAANLLRSREKAKNDFLANMSHELRTPLGILLGMNEQLARGEISPEEQTKIWDIITRNGKQLSRLIDDILDFSKVESDRLTIDPVDFSLPDMISAVAEDFSARAAEKDLKLKVVFDDGVPSIINTDPVRLRQILANLVGNSVKFTHNGSIEIRLHKPSGKIHRVTVTDTGIGLTTEQQAMLFSDFTQVDSGHTRKYGGTGLGLSLSRKLARRLGGDVRVVSSEAGRGSVFEVTVRSNAIAAPVSELDTTAAKTLNAHSRRQILLAEDSEDNVELMKAYLRNTGLQIDIAANGSEAVALAKAKSFDLILMDIQMPVMDGFEATSRIRAQGATLPIIALTAHALPEQRTRALNSGFTDYLTKPLGRDSLLEVLERYLSPAEAQANS